MHNTIVLSMVFVSSIVFATLIVEGEARSSCHCIGQECEVDPGFCKYGEERVCGRRQCAKGPGERCGGPMHYLGRCSDNGLMCTKNERCEGCYNDGKSVTCFADIMNL